jgi:hypothetical protein
MCDNPCRSLQAAVLEATLGEDTGADGMSGWGYATPQASARGGSAFGGEAWCIEKSPMPQLSSCGTESHPAAKIRELFPDG